jgi:hypothetical protein
VVHGGHQVGHHDRTLQRFIARRVAGHLRPVERHEPDVLPLEYEIANAFHIALRRFNAPPASPVA